MTTTMRIERRMPGPTIAIGDRQRSWKILLDGQAVGTLARDQAFETAIEPGRHRLQITSTGSRRSPERTFTAAEESFTEFTCHTQPVWPLMVMALVMPGRWIALKRR